MVIIARLKRRWISDELDKMRNAEELEIAPHLQVILALISQVFF